MVKFTLGCPGPPNAPPALKLDVQAKQTSSASDVREADGAVGKLSRRWPAWITQNTPRPHTLCVGQAKLFIRGFVFGWPGIASGDAGDADKYKFGSHREADLNCC
eukprot:1141195-Pelagomonas_calceolata.AAC.6